MNDACSSLWKLTIERRKHRFGSLLEAQSRAAAGETIFLLPSDRVLDGGIVLKRAQKLIGLGKGTSMVRFAQSSAGKGKAVVVLATGNEVSGIAFVSLASYGIHGANLNASGAVIRDNTFAGLSEGEYDADAPNFAIMLESDHGEVANVVVTGNSVRNGATSGGIQVQQRGASKGRYHFEDNHFNNLPGCAYHLWSQDDGVLDAVILDSSADNIGVGGQNSDSILPHVSGRSSMTVLVKNYRYANTNQVGNPSNCGLEAFVMGATFAGESLWCRGCTLNLTIEDSVFENPVTDGIQLINFGTDARLNIEIRASRVVGANPQQVGGGISLLAKNEQNQGSRTRLLIEDTEVIDSSGFGFALSDQGEGYTAIVDLGGGELGSKGNNRFVGSAKGEVSVIQGVVIARDNWWGGGQVRHDIQGDRSKVTFEPSLSADRGVANTER